MVRARSAFFFSNFILAWLTLTMLVVAYHVKNPNLGAMESWRRNEEFVTRMFQLSLSFAALCGGVLLTFLILEIAIASGWEPQALEVFRPGCEIIEFQPKSPGKSATVIVRLSDRSVQTYIADREEILELEVGSIAHLWVIGKHISRIRTLQKNVMPASVLREERLDVIPQKNAFRAWSTIGVLFLLAAYISGTGFLPMIAREFVVDMGSRRSRTISVESGPLVSLFGFLAFLVGAGIVFGLAYLWKRGWDDTMFEGSNNIWDNRPFRWWRWWS